MKYVMGQKRTMDGVMIKLVILVVGLLVGTLIALWAISYWAQQNPLEAASSASWCGLDDAIACEVLADSSEWINARGLSVSDGTSRFYEDNSYDLQPTVRVQGQRDLLR